MKRALVCGAGGFIGGHLVKKLKREGYWVRGVDIKEHEFAETNADEFRLLVLREPHNCCEALSRCMAGASARACRSPAPAFAATQGTPSDSAPTDARIRRQIARN